MAENQIAIAILAKVDGLKKGLNQATAGIQGFANKAKNFISQHKLAITAGLTAIGAAMVKSIQAYGEEEKAIATLTQALKNQGIANKEAIQDQINFAVAMQKVTTYGDEEVIALQGLLAQYGANGEELKKATQLSLDLAAAKGIDLRAAADLVGKAFVGETGTLSRYGIIIDQGIPKTEKFAAVTAKMQEMFGGQAQAQRETTLGQLTALKNRFGDLQEKLGEELLPVLKSWVRWAEKGLVIVEKLTGSTQANASVNDIAIEQLKRERQALLALLEVKTKNIFSTEKSTEALTRRLNYISRLIIHLTDLKNKEAAAAEAALKSSQKNIAASYQVLIETTAINDERLKQAMKLGHEKNVLAEKEAEVYILNTKAWTDFAKEAAGNVFTSFGQGVADMILEGKKFKDVMTQIWKDLARAVIAEITRMLVRWMAFKAATAAFGGGIASILFQHGGVIGEPTLMKGLHSGRTAIAGEAGPEVIVPAREAGAGGLRPTAPGVAARMAGAGSSPGGMNVTVNISGQFIEGTPSKWAELFRTRILPEIRRYTMVAPTSQFIRRRGAA